MQEETNRNENQYIRDISEIIEVCDNIDISRSRYKKLFETAKRSTGGGLETPHSPIPASGCGSGCVFLGGDIKQTITDYSAVMTILNNIPDLAWLSDAEGRIVAINAGFVAAYGCSAETIIGLPVSSLWPEDIAVRFIEEDEAIMKYGKQKTVINKFVDDEGGKNWFQFIKTPIYSADGSPRGIVGIARDITEYQKVTDELERQVAKKTSELSETNKRLVEEIKERKSVEVELEKAMATVENASRLKSGFISDINFEMRAAMNNIMGLTELIKEDDRFDCTGYIDMIDQSVTKLLLTVNKILDNASKIEPGTLKMSPEIEKEKAHSPAAPAQAPNKPAEQKQGTRILAVEDDVTSRKLLQTLISKRGWEIASVGNGIDAIDRFANNEYDIVLMDIQMPGIDGYETTRKIREIEKDRGKRALIIAVTAFDTQDSMLKCFAAGMDGYIPKPLSTKDFYDRLDRIINMKRR